LNNNYLTPLSVAFLIPQASHFWVFRNNSFQSYHSISKLYMMGEIFYSENTEDLFLPFFLVKFYTFSLKYLFIDLSQHNFYPWIIITLHHSL
jgi:hypothetical protein